MGVPFVMSRSAELHLRQRHRVRPNPLQEVVRRVGGANTIEHSWERCTKCGRVWWPDQREPRGRCK